MPILLSIFLRLRFVTSSAEKRHAYSSLIRSLYLVYPPILALSFKKRLDYSFFPFLHLPSILFHRVYHPLLPFSLPPFASKSTDRPFLTKYFGYGHLKGSGESVLHKNRRRT